MNEFIRTFIGFIIALIIMILLIIFNVSVIYRIIVLIAFGFWLFTDGGKYCKPYQKRN